jgi:hypothetical protein
VSPGRPDLPAEVAQEKSPRHLLGMARAEKCMMMFLVLPAFLLLTVVPVLLTTVRSIT